jgi:hypothetical protein
MSHAVSYQNGTDPNNWIGRCSCGYAYSSTRNEVRKRLLIHEEFFAEETRAWSDPFRRCMMPPAGYSL